VRIVFVSYAFWPPDFGGELLASIERFQSLAANGWNVAVLTSGRVGFPSHEVQRGVNVHRSPIIGKKRFGRLLRRVVFFLWVCWRLILSRFDVLHFGSSGAIGPISSAISTKVLLLLARLKGARTVTVHSLADTEQSAFDTYGWKGFWRKASFSGFSCIVAVSPALYEGLRTHFPNRVTLLPYGVRDDVFTRSPEARRCLRAEEGVEDGDVIFTFLGSVCSRKGFDLLAQAFAELAPDHANWHLWVIGPYTREQNQNLDDYEVTQVTKPLESAGRQVKFWGRVDERASLSRILSAGDVFVFPSRKEGMGIAPMEAMAVGLPVIIARIPGVTDLANIDGETGYYIPQGDLGALKDAMIRLGSNESLRRQMGQRAAEVIRESFGWEQHVTNWLKLYDGGAATERTSHKPAKDLTLKS
jgi:glycosyltransferase involved in cell wall biosynthesis